MRARVVWLVLVALLVVCVWWWGVQHGVGARVVEAAPPAEPPVVATATPSAPQEAVAASPQVPRDPADSAQTVLVEVVDREGRPIAASFTIAEFPGRAAPMIDLSPKREALAARQREELGVRKEAAADGRLRIERGTPTGIALFVQGNGRASQFLRVPPHVGSTSHRIVLDDSSCHLHVLVWDSELHSPASAAVVECDDAQGRVVHSARTDAAGTAILKVEPTQYLVRVAGADPLDRESRCPVGFERDRGATQTVVLAMPERRFDVKLVVHATAANAAGVAPSLGFARIDGERDGLVPALQSIQPGDNVATLRLTAGTWRAILLPQGSRVIESGDALLRVGPDGPREFRLEIGPGTARHLVLNGLAKTDFPVRVRFFDVEDLDESVGTQAFAGALTWHGPEGEVGAWPDGARLLVHHRNRSWLGDLPAAAGGGGATVDLVAATTVRLTVAEASSTPIATLVHARGGAPRAMHRRLLDQGLGAVPVWFLFDVVPNGPVDVTIATAGGAVIAQRQMEATGGVMDLRL